VSLDDMRREIEVALAEDIGGGDLTAAAVVPAGARARSRIEQRAPGVLSGLGVAEGVFRALDPAIEWRPLAAEGEWRDAEPAVELAGMAAAIVTGERTALNFLGRLSGIATLTARYVAAVEGTGVRILDTRKTTPGLREFEKAAVRAGGGHNHRAGLHDAILVKENHATLAGGVGEATRRALGGAAPEVIVEVECGDQAEVEEALAAGAGRILLDNMGPAELRLAVKQVDGRAELEASGGITLANVRAAAETGVDFVSVGALTHSAPALDLSLIVERG
jgi:nicotinate-nucleotide pyrophosphorylase (carboxylating)